MTATAGLFRRNWFPISAGLICFVWAFMAWLTVIPNQDLLADGIQVQSLIHDPRIVLSFPGQKHGGVIEYPFNVLAEWIAPGNYFLESAIRPIFAFLTGFFAARLYLTYFARAPRWSFLLAVAVGPTVLHGLAGPEGNPVGVWWLNANYDLAWLFVILGFWLLGREVTPAPFPNSRVPRTWMILVSGIIIGLGFYQQPTSIMLIIPMAVLFLLRFRIRAAHILVLLVGGAIGIIPSVLSYFFAPVTTWNPSHFPVFQPHLALASLGLDGIPNYVVAVLPSALGFAPPSSSGAAQMQSIVTGVFLFAMVICAGVGTVSAIKQRRRLSAGASISVTWLAVACGIVLFGVFVDPVWFYSAHLALILWMSIGLLPILVNRRAVGSVLAWIAICLIGVNSVTQNATWYLGSVDHFSAKRQYLTSLVDSATEIKAAGADYLYGSYYDVLPIGYGSAGALRSVTSTYDRFPLSGAQPTTNLSVAVNATPTDDWGRTALREIQAACTSVGATTVSGKRSIQVFSCPPSALMHP